MNVRKEINLYATEEDKSILMWLFDRYSIASQWRFVAQCSFVKYGNYSYQVNRIWKPTEEGKALYYYLRTEKNKEE